MFGVEFGVELEIWVCEQFRWIGLRLIDWEHGGIEWKNGKEIGTLANVLSYLEWAKMPGYPSYYP